MSASPPRSIGRELKESELSYRFMLVLYFIVIGPILFFCFLSFSFRHSYQLPITAPGNLISDRWSFSFVREILFALYLLVFLSGPLMRLSRSRSGLYVHLVLMFILFVFCLLTLAADVVDLTRANLPPNNQNFDPSNLARDARWCCVYAGQPGTDTICANDPNIASCPALSASQLRLDGIYITRFAVNLIIGAFLLYDFLSTAFVYLPLLNRYLGIDQSNSKSR